MYRYLKWQQFTKITLNGREYLSFRWYFVNILAPITMSPWERGHTLHCSKTLWGALWRLENSAGQRMTAKLPREVLEPLKCAPQNYGAPAEFWSNATCALLFDGDIVTGGKIPTKIIFLDFPYVVRVIIVNHCHFRDLYNQYDYF